MTGIILIFSAALIALAFSGDEYGKAREAMVRDQIEARGVKDARVLAAMRKTPRDAFVESGLREAAYADSPLPIERDQTISQPYIVAFMTEALRLSPGAKVLEVGTGSGYQAAVLAEITDKVYTIEIICELAESAEKRLRRLGYDKVQVKCGDGYAGWKEHEPFDAIVVTAAPDKVPQPLVDQLAEGGRLVIPVGSFFQSLVRITKVKGEAKKETLMPVRFVPMTGPGTGVTIPK